MEFCLNIPPAHTPSDYFGTFTDHNNPNEELNVQYRGQIGNANEGSSRTSQLILDNNGKNIDLNIPWENQNNDGY